MLDPDVKLPYRVEPDGAEYKVLDWENNVVILAGTEANARQYAALMNQSYRAGYKAGFRNAKRSN